MNWPSLWVVPSVPVWQDARGLCFEIKFYEGILEYLESWPGKVHCLMRLASDATPRPSFGSMVMEQALLPFSCSTIGPDETFGPQHFSGAGVVLASGDAADQLGISRICTRLGVPSIYVIEYTLDTRLRILALETPNWLRRGVRMLRAGRDEWRRRAAFRSAAGLQANGVPAAQAYRWADEVQLYFDTRARQASVISSVQLERRLAQVSRPGHRLQLAFSGRLIRMKGADHLLPIARKLKAQGVNFDLHVFGAGELEAELRREAQASGLGDVVHFGGAVDFGEVLMPRLKATIDLFLMPHPQADPSCTYLETLACGVPILGYDNQAMLGVLQQAPVGWSVPIGDDDAMAAQIHQLAQNREALVERSRQALAFASQHTLEKEFALRIEHIKHVWRKHMASAR